MKKTIVVYHGLGIPDSQLDIIMPGAIKAKDNKVWVTKEFTSKIEDAVCQAEVMEESGDLKIIADLPDSVNGLYPAIGFQVIASEQRPDGIRIINDAKLHWVGLCINPNIDENIKQIC